MNSGANNLPPRPAADASASVISLRDISKSYRLWHSAGSHWVTQLARSLSGVNAASAIGRNGDRDFLALKNISLEISAGESVGIIGRNGCGKSTLLQILAGILKPSSGSGTVKGEVAALLELGTGFHPDFSGRENVVLNNAMLDLPRAAARERMAQIEAFADLGRFMDEPIRTYSSGMLLRLGFACAIAVDPDVFLVDEALAVGDIFFQQKCFEYMRERLGEKTRVIVSHDMHSITSFCTRVLVLDAGTVVFDGPPLQSVEYYLKVLHDSQSGAAQKMVASSGLGETNVNPVPVPSAAEWWTVPETSIGGVGEIKIRQVEIRVNDVPFASVIKSPEVVSVRMTIDCHLAKPSILFGYLVRDKLGNAIFGENSVGVAGGVVGIQPGQFEVAFEFAWPEIQAGDYFLTLGIGEGHHPVRHRIQCWAHNIHLFNAINPGRQAHGLFNNPLRAFRFTAGTDALPETATSEK